ncbi:hypothetical protein EDD18DRAFT_1360012 [Armillaria luteobubalina]|uniref:Nephrocystin 3-like N-terminal domain-containing protein n=1 Tax=Armillaria luteobubalina TaxID=153913 RepID=A0AA39PQA6_9AGAR|nr:hypothetical protein EDD18DRAFT_1360012 [Armillaria luteobubalina]
MSAATSTQKTMANEERRMLFIRELEIVKIAPTKESRFHLKITAGDKKQKTKVIKIGGVGFLPKWTQNLTLDFDPQAVILWELYGRRWSVIPRFKVLGSVEKKLGEFFEGDSDTSADIHLYNGSSEVAVLKVSVKLDSPSNVLMAVVPNIEKPSESSKFLDPSTLQTVLDATKKMVDTLAGVHPAATIAWGFLSIGFEMLKKYHDMKPAALDLYTDMISTCEEFSKDDIVEQRVRLQNTYKSLFKQIIECAIFIEGYTKKSETEHFFAMDVSTQARRFHLAFADLKNQLSREYAKEAVIVTLGVQKTADVLLMRDRLRDLHPPQELGPKSWCMQGTRVATIDMMLLWIAQCDGRTMWCKGLVGTGKSSLMGTLHESLTTKVGGQSQLAAFVRYDRLEYSKASKLITSIAYSLGMFDDRIGMAISQVIQTLPSVVTLPPSAQFQHLLCNPLESLPDLSDGGPLVVIIDGLDECDASKELLVVLAGGFGPKLPFMRLIISSRPVLHIATAFQEQDCIYPLYLDTSSKAVNNDIHFYLEQELATICNNAFQEKCIELDTVNKLTEWASGLFIWAATVVRFVHALPGILRLQTFLATKPPRDATEALTILYCTALETLMSEQGVNADIKKYVRSVLGALLVASQDGWAGSQIREDILDNIVLQGEGSPPSHHIVSMLGSVLSPETKCQAIHIIHKSFDDFLQDQSRCGDDWFINVALHYKTITDQCQIISKSFLKMWSPTSDMNFEAIPAYISKYALFGKFWYSTYDRSDIELITSFFHSYFLPWMNVVVEDDDTLSFEIMDTVCQQHGPTKIIQKCHIRNSTITVSILQASSWFHHRHLHYSSQESPLKEKITLEWKNSKTPSSSWNPIGDNLNFKDMIFLDDNDMGSYRFKITNATLMPLYVFVFDFYTSDLKISM